MRIKQRKALVEHVTGKKLKTMEELLWEITDKKLVVTGGVGFLIYKKLLTFKHNGLRCAIHISGKSEGTFYIRTERSVSGNLDKFTAWLDNRPGGAWWYQYE